METTNSNTNGVTPTTAPGVTLATASPNSASMNVTPTTSPTTSPTLATSGASMTSTANSDANSVTSTTLASVLTLATASPNSTLMNDTPTTSPTTPPTVIIGGASMNVTPPTLPLPLSLATVPLVVSPLSLVGNENARDRKRRQDLLTRKHRALQEPIYFINHQVRSEYVQFQVLGTSGNAYNVDFFVSQRTDKPTWTCGCPDYKIHKRTCKHIQFIWYRVLGIDALTVVGGNQSQPFFDSANAVVDRLTQHRVVFQHTVEYKNRDPSLDEKQVEIHDNPFTDDVDDVNDGIIKVGQRPYVGESCPICYEAFTSGCEVYYCESKCGNSVHKTCYQACVRFSKKMQCPYCRSNMQPKGLDLAVEPRSHKKRRHLY